MFNKSLLPKVLLTLVVGCSISFEGANCPALHDPKNTAHSEILEITDPKLVLLILETLKTIDKGLCHGTLAQMIHDCKDLVNAYERMIKILKEESDRLEPMPKKPLEVDLPSTQGLRVSLRIDTKMLIAYCRFLKRLKFTQKVLLMENLVEKEKECARLIERFSELTIAHKTDPILDGINRAIEKATCELEDLFDRSSSEPKDFFTEADWESIDEALMKLSRAIGSANICLETAENTLKNQP